MEIYFYGSAVALLVEILDLGIEGLLVRDSPESVCCVLEQDSLKNVLIQS